MNPQHRTNTSLAFFALGLLAGIAVCATLWVAYSITKELAPKQPRGLCIEVKQ